MRVDSTNKSEAIGRHDGVAPINADLNNLLKCYPRNCRYVSPVQEVDYFMAIAKDILEQRKQQRFTGNRDLVQLMLEAHEEQVEGVSKLSDDEIMAQSMAFLVAGFETTGKLPLFYREKS